jgi:hypothetical protein
MDNLLIRLINKIEKSAFCVFLCSLLMLSCASTPLPRGGSVTVPEDFFGLVHAGRRLTPEENQLLDEMQVQWVLNTFYWGSIESEKGNFDFSRYDAFVDSVKSQGIKIVAVLAYDTPWLYPNRKTKSTVSSEHLPYFLNFVEETVRHFQGRVDVWEIWNEPNFVRFWKSKIGEYYELTRQTAQRIREIDPEAYILGGAFIGAPSSFIRNMHRANAMENLDGLAFHPYALNPTSAMRIYDNFLKILSEINFTGSVWITEAGYPTGGWYPTKAPLNEFPSYVVRTIVGAAARGASTLLWYELYDRADAGTKSNDSEAYFGLAYPDYTRKNGGWAYELCARFLPGSRYTPELPVREGIASNIVSFCFLGGTSGNNTLILWNDRNGNQNIRLTLSGNIYLYDISTGISSPLLDGTILAIGSQPLFITWQGTDIPRLSRTNQ